MTLILTMSTKQILIIPGSVRKAGMSQKIADALQSLCPDWHCFIQSDISKLPFYDADIDTPELAPQSWVDFRDMVRKSDAVLLIAPEYNRNISAPLKNALDIGSRPYQAGDFAEKLVGVLSVTVWWFWGLAANTAVRQVGAVINMRIILQPEWCISYADTYFDEQWGLTPSWKNELESYMRSFLKRIEDSQ